jgi:hypothetical protein
MSQMKRKLISLVAIISLALVAYVYMSYRAAVRYVAPVRDYLDYRGFVWGHTSGEYAFDGGEPGFRFLHNFEIRDGLSCRYNGLSVAVDMMLHANGVDGKYECTNRVVVDEDFCSQIRKEVETIRGEKIL